MKCERKRLVSLVALLAVIGVGPAAADAAGIAAPYREGEILVRFRKGVPPSRVREIHARHRATVKQSHPRLGFETVAIPEGPTVEEMIRRYLGEPEVEVAEPNYLVWALVLPNDPSFALQWALDNTGQTYGTPGADIDALVAWTITKGDPSIVVAVVDSGVGISHPDLAGRIWVNPGELPDNEIDDDGNGYVDDAYGWDFVGRMNWPDDFNGHGTHVASIIAAVQGNGIGISGIAPGVRVMPVQVLDALGQGDYATAADGIAYAADNGARIANMSFGGLGDSAIFHDALRYAYGRGVTLVAAAGNEYGPPVLYPAAYDDVTLAVAASDHFDRRASFSSAGPSVDVSAPGKDIYAAWRYHQIGPEKSRFIYTMASGTSMASPVAAGVAALVLSRNPSLTPAQVMDQLKYTAEDVNAAEHPGRDDWMGFGRVNAYRALTMSPRPAISVLSSSVNDATGNANGRADPGEAVGLTVTLANAWADAASVTAALTSGDPCISVTSGTASFGPIAAGAVASNSTSPFALQVSPTCPSGKKASLTLVVNADGVSTALSVPLMFGYPPILFVCDDAGDGRRAYTDGLDALGVAYDVWDVPFDADGPPASELAPYAVVIWDAVRVAKSSGFVTTVSRTLSSADVASLRAYLDGGGRLLLASSTLAEGADLAPELPAFIATYLHSGSMATSPHSSWVAGAAGERFAGICLQDPVGALAFVDPDAASVSLFVDDDPASSYPGRSVGLLYPATGAALYRVVYLGFDLHQVDSPDTGRFVLRRSMETLLEQPLSPKPNLAPRCKTPEYHAIDADGDGSEKVTLDAASASYDPEQGSLSFLWKEGASTLSKSATPAPKFAVGTHYLSLTCTDPAGAAETVALVAQIDPAITANSAPSIPTMTIAPTAAQTGVPTAFTAMTTDPDGEPIHYNFDWKGPGWLPARTFLTQLWPSGVSATLAHAFPAPGGYTVRVRAFDRTGDQISAVYSYSDPIYVTVSDPGAPSISNVRATDVTESTAVVRWTTSSPATSFVRYTRERGSYSWSEAADPTLTTEHAVTITNLWQNRTTFFEVRSADAAGATAVDWNAGAFYRVVTLPGVNLLHVKDVSATLVQDSKTYATAAVTVVDQADGPVAGATVSGSWSGTATDRDVGVTDATGRVTARSDATSGTKLERETTVYVFTVDDVSLAGWTYENTANVTSSDFAVPK